MTSVCTTIDDNMSKEISDKKQVLGVTYKIMGFVQS